ncbi:Alpha/Beta hydrolase protein [Hypoxylon argillaceum]|nr:Alpha/Beta hydrolase protein [Hypoxylon argillaceum]
MSTAPSLVLKAVLVAIGVPVGLYLGAISLLIVAPSFQAYAVYLHKFGFLHNQAVPFYIDTEDGFSLHAWQIVPSRAYHKHEEQLLNQDLSGPVPDITSTVNLRLLREDPEARLVLYMHGTSGTIGSTVRPASYRNIYSADADHIHVLTFDYRGYGLSSGVPTEPGLLLDALAVVKWATTVAQIPHDRIVVYGQSMGSAVTASLVNHMATYDPSHPFAGVIISASFTDLPSLTATYRIGGVIPVLAPIAKLPPLFRFFTSRLRDTWVVKDKIAEFIRRSNNYHLTLIHSEDDADIPVSHTQELFWHAVNATRATPISFPALEKDKARKKVDLGPGGWYVDWVTQKGTIRLHTLKYGLHDWQMTYPVTSSAVRRAFQSTHPNFAALN